MSVAKPRRTALLACVSALAICAAGAGTVRAQDRVYPDGSIVLTADENITGSLTVGQGGTAHLSIEDAVIDVDNLVLIGDQPDDEGYVIVQLDGQLNALYGEISLGRSGGYGNMWILTGADVSTLTTVIGGAGTGALTVDGAGSTLTTDYIRAGVSLGDGYLTISGGGLVASANNALLGELSGAFGRAIVTGAGSLWDHQGGLFVGNGGDGELAIADGGEVRSGVTGIGELANASGAVTVSGTDAVWLVSDRMYVGNQGAGTLTIANGGRVTKTAGTMNVSAIGFGPGSTGSVTVTGPGSLWESDSGLYVGLQGAGTLLIEAGGQVTSLHGTMGQSAGVSGIATVTGAGSLWDNSGAIVIGQWGDGTLVLADDGVARAGGGTGIVHMATNSGATGELAIGAAAGDVAAAAGTLEASEVRFGGLGAAASVTFNHTETDYVFSPLITGAIELNHYAGTTILTADNTYTGDTTVHGGTLVVEGASDQGGGGYVVGQIAGDDGALTVRAGYDPKILSERVRPVISSSARSTFGSATLPSKST